MKRIALPIFLLLVLSISNINAQTFRAFGIKAGGARASQIWKWDKVSSAMRVSGLTFALEWAFSAGKESGLRWCRMFMRDQLTLKNARDNFSDGFPHVGIV